jgi:hypothetical protein
MLNEDFELSLSDVQDLTDLNPRNGVCLNFGAVRLMPHEATHFRLRIATAKDTFSAISGQALI